MSKKLNQRLGSKRMWLTVILLALIGAAIVLTLWHDKKILTTQPSHSNSSSNKSLSSTSTGHIPSANNSSNQGGTTTQNSQATNKLPPSSEWTSSSNGDITLQQPIATAIISPGDTISGLANVSTVQFILTDNSVGLIDQGTLNVANGEFSGTLQFTPHSSTGTLQVYYPNPSNGAEEDIVNINVNFSF
jgi:cytoskeletal protein RodZ